MIDCGTTPCSGRASRASDAERPAATNQAAMNAHLGTRLAIAVAAVVFLVLNLHPWRPGVAAEPGGMPIGHPDMRMRDARRKKVEQK